MSSARALLRGRRLDWLLGALLLALPVLFFWRVLTPNLAERGSFASGDFNEQFYAFAHFTAEQLSQGQLPLWNPYTYAGHPFIADVQSAVFYPPSILVMLLSPWLGGFSMYTLEWQAVLHFALAGVGMYLFARNQLRRANIDAGAQSPVAPCALSPRTQLCAFIAAIVFTFGGYLTAYPSQQLAILETDAWLPLILLCLSRAFEVSPRPAMPAKSAWQREKFARLREPALAGVCFGMALLAGHPQSAFYLLLLSLAFALYSGRLQHRWRWRDIGLACLCFLFVALGVAAAQWLPSLEFMQVSSRSNLGYTDYARGFELQDPLQVLLPGSVSLYSPLYLGIAPLGLVIAALYLPRRVPRAVRFWLALALVGLMLSFGGNLFLYPLLYLFVPGFQLFRQQERAAFVVAFALAMLSGYGALALTQILAYDAHRRLRALLRLCVAAALGAALLFVLIYFAWMQFELNPLAPFRAASSQAAWLALMLTLFAAVLGLRVRTRLRRSAVLVLLIALSVLDLFTVTWHNNFQASPPDAQTRAPEYLRLVVADNSLFRTYNEFRLFGNFGDLFGLEDTGGASPLRLARYEALTTLPMQRLWALLNVKYVITWRQSLADLGVQSELVARQQVSDTESTYVHRLLHVRPRAVVVTQVEAVAGDREVLQRLASPDFDFTQHAVLEAPLARPVQGDAAGSATLIEHSPTKYAWQAHAPGDALFVLSENDYPGWHAFVDGAETPIMRADYALMAVGLPAGEHRVEFVFDPLSVKLGALLSAVTIVCLLGGSLIL